MWASIDKKEVIAMRWMKRRHRVEGNRRRERNFEKERAWQALRNAVLILFMGFVMLGIAFSAAWHQ